MYDALLKYKDVVTVSRYGLKIKDVIQDMKYEETNLKELTRESILKYNEGF